MSKGLRLALPILTLVSILAVTAGSSGAVGPASRVSLDQPRAISKSGSAATWTVMVYMSGDNNLESYIVKDLERELAAMGSTPDVQVTALADRGPGFDASRGNWQTTKLFHPTQGMRANAANAVADWGERNMGKARTLKDFVAWSKATYPADHYALYFWGHGWGWHPDWTMADDSSGASGDGLNPDEIESVLPSLGFIDVVAYDACNMSQIEIADLWHGHATALAASQEYVNMRGIEYDVVLAQLDADPSMSADQLAINTAASAKHEATFAAMAVDARYEALREAVDAWSIAMENALGTRRAAIIRGFHMAKSFWHAPTDLDLFDLAKRVDAQVTGATIKAKSTAVMDAVEASVLYRRSTGAANAKAHGITITGITRPAQKNADWRYYHSLGFAAATRWDEFLDLLAA